MMLRLILSYPFLGNVLEHAALVGMEVRFAPANEFPDSYISFVSDGRADYPTNDDSKFGEYLLSSESVPER